MFKGYYCKELNNRLLNEIIKSFLRDSDKKWFIHYASMKSNARVEANNRRRSERRKIAEQKGWALKTMALAIETSS